MTHTLNQNRTVRNMAEGDAAISLCGQSVFADKSGALFWPSFRTLIVADLHFEKGSSFARTGQFLPPYDTRETLLRLATVLQRYDPAIVIALGDSLHDGGAAERISDEDRITLDAHQAGRRWIWITGNHDPKIPERLGGEVLPSATLGNLHFRHLPLAGSATHEVAGHLHPAARVAVRASIVRKPCFVANGRRLVLPAFGSYTGGLNVLDTAFHSIFGDDGMKVWMLGQSGVFPVATRQLRGD